MTKVILPPLGEGINKATVSYWFFKVVDKVYEKEDLVELTTDKAAFNLPCPCTGTITQIILSEGQEVQVGDTLAVIE